jgi:hypothetical protein
MSAVSTVLFAVLFVAAAGAVALWIDVRFPRLGPAELPSAMAHLFAAAIANEMLDGALGGFVAGSALPQSRLVAIVGIILPLVIYAVLAALWVLRIAHRALSGHLR